MKAIRRPQPQGKFLAFTLVFSSVLLGFAALSVDIGVIAATRSQLKTVADAAALAGARQLVSDSRLSSTYIPITEVVNANSKAIAIGQANAVLGHAAVIQTSDLAVGTKTLPDPNDSTFTSTTSTTTNSVQVTARRDASHGGIIPAYFSRVLGSSGSSASVTSTATVEVFTIGGFTAGTSPSNVLPITMLKSTYDSMFTTPITDNYSYSPSGGTYGTVTAGHDGEPEAQMYAIGNQPGNYGTVNFGVSNNSTSILGNQISNGITQAQMDAQFPPNGVFSFNNTGTLTLSGNTGISSGIKDNLTGIIGKPEAVLLYTSVTGPGNNASYTVVGFGAMRIVAVDFQGQNKNVVIQRAFISDPTATPGTGTTFQNGGVIRLHLSR